MGCQECEVRTVNRVFAFEIRATLAADATESQSTASGQGPGQPALVAGESPSDPLIDSAGDWSGAVPGRSGNPTDPE